MCTWSPMDKCILLLIYFSLSWIFVMSPPRASTTIVNSALCLMLVNTLLNSSVFCRTTGPGHSICAFIIFLNKRSRNYCTYILLAGPLLPSVFSSWITLISPSLMMDSHHMPNKNVSSPSYCYFVSHKLFSSPIHLVMFSPTPAFQPIYIYINEPKYQYTHPPH